MHLNAVRFLSLLTLTDSDTLYLYPLAHKSNCTRLKWDNSLHMSDWSQEPSQLKQKANTVNVYSLFRFWPQYRYTDPLGYRSRGRRNEGYVLQTHRRVIKGAIKDIILTIILYNSQNIFVHSLANNLFLRNTLGISTHSVRMLTSTKLSQNKHESLTLQSKTENRKRTMAQTKEEKSKCIKRSKEQFKVELKC